MVFKHRPYDYLDSATKSNARRFRKLGTWFSKRGKITKNRSRDRYSA